MLSLVNIRFTWARLRAHVSPLWRANLLPIIFFLFSCNFAYAISGRMIHGHGVHAGENLHLKLIPASVQKVITMYLAWNILGPNYRFHTHLLQVTPLQHYQLSFTFDPTLKERDLELLIQKLPKHTPIRLDLVSNGLTQPRNPMWEKEDLHYCYASPVGPAILNENCAIETKIIKVTRAKLTQTKAAKKRAPTKLSATTKKITRSVPYNTYGLLPQHIKKIAKKYHVNIQHAQWVMSVKKGSSLAVYSSPPLSQLMLRGLKHSHNLIMDSIWFASAQKLLGHKRLNWAQASEVLMNYLKKKYTWGNKFHISDGSGLSSHNRVSVSALNALLHVIEKNESLYRWSLQAFPTASVDGTMKNSFHRYKKDFEHYKIVAKTGTFKRVRNYCGWVTQMGGKKLRFIWIENANPSEKLVSRQSQEDAMIKFISPFAKKMVRKRP